MVISIHAKARAGQRNLPISFFEEEIRAKPTIVFEQQSDTTGERQFNAYYRQTEGYFHRYVLTLNDELRLITLMRVKKEAQRRIAGDRK